MLSTGQGAEEDGILASIPPSEAGNLNCAEVLSLLLVLKIG
jgi:hypothetical protein